ncbi:MAG TPA: phosphoglucosamine mutase [Bacteroidales bacterium]|nr:phosphoglucosamine mutase [Bacteroidales bacterium]HPS71221.1 phosphoglucosamine mutase [Bacteroidales bacterium]
MALIKSISGIRGTIGGNVGENLTPIDIVKFTSAFVSLTKQKNTNPLTFIVGRDARISGEMVNQLVCATLQSMGVNVIDLGLSTTPTVEMAVIQQKADGGIILTASHNPMQWNALKLLNEKGEFISGEEGKELLQLAEKEDFEYNSVKELGSYSSYNKAIDDHIDAILKLDLVDAKAIRSAHFSVVIDTVNSTGGIALPKLLDKLGVKNVHVLYGEPNGIFPHNPEPLPENLTEISEVMRKGDYHIGFVVDPDVDRLAMVMENGEMFGEEYTLVAVADYVLQNRKGNTVSNLSSSRALRDISEKYEVTYQAAAVGEVNVVEKMKEINAVIGGEGNGGIILPELHYGRDALVGIALFLTYMAKTKRSCSEIRSTYPEYYISKNKIELSPDMDIPSILKGIAEKYNQHQVNNIDGVKIDFPDNWVHLRASNTEPIIRIYAEAFTMGVADNLAKKIMGDIAELVKTTE